MKPLRKFLALFRKGRLDAEMTEEMRLHVEQRTRENIAAGMSPEDARFAALRKFGGVEQAKEVAREQRAGRWLEQFVQDLRYAVRTLAKVPSFTVTAVLTLALGIGVNAALFTVFNAVALRPLPVKDPDALVTIKGWQSQRGAAFFPYFSHAEYLFYRDSNRVLAGLVAANEASARLPQDTAARDPLIEGRDPGTVAVEFVSDNYFSLLGGEMMLGRGLTPADNQAPGVSPVIVLSHLFWQRHFHSDPSIVGKTIMLSRPYTIVGVTAPEFAGQRPAPPAAWIPLMMWGKPGDYGATGAKTFRLIGRLLPGVTEEQAKADLDLLAVRYAKEFPGEGGKDSVRLERGMRFVNIPANPQTAAALAPVVLGFGMVLIVACTNVANLLLARGVARQHEIGVRLTLGAGRGRVIRQLLTENALLCVLGAAVGLVFAWWTLEVLQPLVFAHLPADRAHETRRLLFLQFAPDLRVVGFTGGLAVLTVFAAGLLPALHAGSGNLISSLKREGTPFSPRLSQSRLRDLLMVAQVAVCLMLLSCTGLFVRNLLALRRADLGFDPRAVFIVNVSSRIGAVSDQRSAPAQAQATVRQVVETVRGLPGVAAAGVALDAPVSGRGGTTALVRRPGADGASKVVDKIRSFEVATEFFDLFGISLVRGRGFTPAEVESGVRAVVVSESVARRFWPQSDPIGQALAIGGGVFDPPGAPVPAGALMRWSPDELPFHACEVIGVAKDIVSRVDASDRQMLYLPRSATSASRGAMFVRARSDSAAALAEIVRTAEAAGVTLRFSHRVSDDWEERMLPFSALAILSGALGALALLMASVGLYGAMAFGVNQRVREIGIRLALGATAARVVRLFVRQGMRLVAIGVVVGWVGGGLFALLLAKILYGLGGAVDPLAFAAATAIFGAVALFASWLPARRAAKTDPMVALRAE